MNGVRFSELCVAKGTYLAPACTDRNVDKHTIWQDPAL